MTGLPPKKQFFLIILSVALFPVKRWFSKRLTPALEQAA
jgi:hypothetical protein